MNLKLTLTLDETNLVLEALGNLPFARVFHLINAIQTQAKTQLEPPASPPETQAPDASSPTNST
jgi:hypothetical protein